MLEQKAYKVSGKKCICPNGFKSGNGHSSHDNDDDDEVGGTRRVI